MRNQGKNDPLIYMYLATLKRGKHSRCFRSMSYFTALVVQLDELPNLGPVFLHCEVKHFRCV